MGRDYFKLWYRLDGDDSFLIWYTDEKDGLVADSNNKILSFQNEKDLLSYAKNHGLVILAEDTKLFDLDKISEWLQGPKAETVDCREFLHAWNLFEDVSHSVRSDFDKEHDKTNKVYDKLFWGNNLPVVTPKGKYYVPIWTKREVKTLHEIMTSGIELLRKSIRHS